MLSELRIENLAVIHKAGLKLSGGLNVITGETGAGKTILAHAISLLLGSRADSSLIRPDADEASVEAVFRVPVGCFADLAADIDIDGGEDLAVRRRLTRDGRSRAWAGGRTVSLAVLGQLTGRLLEFSAQHEQRRLMMAARQLDILDSFGGRELRAAREEYARVYERRAAIIGQLDALAQATGDRSREAELLEFQADEITAASLRPGEDEELLRERELLARAGELKEATGSLAVELGAAGGESGELMARMAQALKRVEEAAGVDEALDAIAERLRGGYFELEEVGRAARDYAESVRHDPVRLAEIEERLDLIAGLKRKYGQDIEEIIRFGDEAAGRLKSLDESGEARKALERGLGEVEGEALDRAALLRDMRLNAAAGLQQEATGHLRELAFNRCDFEVRLSPAGDSDAAGITAAQLGHAGADIVEFHVSLNPGMPAAPLKDTASGGELSRVMLAIKSAISEAGEVATMVFDEIDAGIGGETGAAVGGKLKRLAAGSQIICITHLPQIACFADAHFSVVKSAGDDDTSTVVKRLEGDAIVDELCRMMGSAPDDSEARAHAGSLLKKARPA